IDKDLEEFYSYLSNLYTHESDSEDDDTNVSSSKHVNKNNINDKRVAENKCEAKISDKELESRLVEELESRIVEELKPKPVEYEEVISEVQIKDPDELSDTKSDEYDKCFTSGSKKITDIFSLKNVKASEFFESFEFPKFTEFSVKNYDFIFNDIYNSSDDDDSKFILGSLDLLLKNKSNNLWLRMKDTAVLFDKKYKKQKKIPYANILKLSQSEVAISDKYNNMVDIFVKYNNSINNNNILDEYNNLVNEYNDSLVNEYEDNLVNKYEDNLINDNNINLANDNNDNLVIKDNQDNTLYLILQNQLKNISKISNLKEIKLIPIMNHSE
ncbi:1902_t:CDS:2, partial [Racocetra persica]